ncbi:mitogen-activated protein kinase kinase kinase 5-like [Tropilaelaps mercedesae]|uniref:Mitogen-activated protein kinase kinase kinase 5-like n=1 Tax=Tropilaelaps mercedesae TaxID=418985 RepID=A0A1V9XZQ8_9ACAR|nr:mitogen-activated protein kinase kinase kinase 5-like [Tropilaelaps mercedesae]
MMERLGSVTLLGSCGSSASLISPMDTLEDSERVRHSDPLGPGERELRWSLLRVRCWDCWEEPGAWLKECDTDIEAELPLERAAIWHNDENNDCVAHGSGVENEDCSGKTAEEQPLYTGDIGSHDSGNKCTMGGGSVTTPLAAKLQPTNRKRPSYTMLLSPFVISSGLLSPPVDGGPLNGVEDNGGFYMLKKDSQRRQTIVKVMQEDKEQCLAHQRRRMASNGYSITTMERAHMAVPGLTRPLMS